MTTLTLKISDNLVLNLVLKAISWIKWVKIEEKNIQTSQNLFETLELDNKEKKEYLIWLSNSMQEWWSKEHDNLFA